MARLIGDGMYYVIVDVVVEPAYQKRKRIILSAVWV